MSQSPTVYPSNEEASGGQLVLADEKVSMYIPAMSMHLACSTRESPMELFYLKLLITAGQNDYLVSKKTRRTL